MNETNWIATHVNRTVTEADRRALEKAKRQEKEKLSKGYRYVKVNDRTEVLVPCDKNGKPTKEGLARIKKLKSVL